jgi:hypothetical protein
MKWRQLLLSKVHSKKCAKVLSKIDITTFSTFRDEMAAVSFVESSVHMLSKGENDRKSVTN